MRDDGVITMSHAKNWVDYGFIGVNPSGPRVEGYSAPVEFFLYAALYRLFDLRYDTYANLQTLAGSFLLGALFIRFFRDRPASALALTAFAAFLLTMMGSFFLWHGSGLENAITHVLFLATAYLLYRFVETEQIRFAYAPVVFLATVSRIDSVFHIAPLLLLFALIWRVSRKSLAGFAFGSLVFLLWAAFQAWRFLYFGAWTPNTAVAHNISLQQNLLLWWNGEFEYLHESVANARIILVAHGAGFLVLISLLQVFWVPRRGWRFLLVAGLLLTAVAAVHPFALGPARLMASRTTTHLALFTVLSTALLLSGFLGRRYLVHRIAAVAAAALCTLHFHSDEALAPRPVCCNIPDFEPMRLAVERAAAEHRLPRPSVALPDLGFSSWHKRFNVFDLGMIGSPLIAKLRHGPALPLYLLDYAAPDLIVVHDAWFRPYEYSLFRQPAFRARYTALFPGTWTIKYYEKDGTETIEPLQIWIRKAVTHGAETRERRLIDVMHRAPAVDLLARELARCRRDTFDRCTYVARTAYRFRPELVRAGLRDPLFDLFSFSPTRALDRYLLAGANDGSLLDPALRSVMDSFVASVRPLLRNDNRLYIDEFTIYAWGPNLIYHKEPCAAEDALRQFRLRGVRFPSESELHEAQARAVLRRAPSSFFSLRDVGYVWGRRCIAVFPLEREGSMLVETSHLGWNGQSGWRAIFSHRFAESGPGWPVRGAPDP